MAASILCVDDDRNLCQIVARALRGEGYDVFTAFDGDEAIEQINQHEPDLMLLDVLLPRRDGFEVLEEIRGLGGSVSQVPVVLMTGCTPTPVYAQRANTLKALDLLTKPVPLEKIIEVATTQLGEAKAASEDQQAPRPGGISGRLERIPFPAILHHLHGLRASGVLQIASEKKRKWIQLRDGYPVAVRSNLVRETLGHLLVRTGRITRTVLEESRRQMEVGDRRQGEILVAMEVLSEEEITAALKEQADEKLFEIFSWTSGEFQFERGARLQRANALGLERSPANLVLRGVRTAFPIERVDRYLQTHGQRYVAHGESPFYRFQDVQIEPAEEALLRGLDGTQRLADFAGEDESLRRTIYGLLASGLLELRRTGDQEKAAVRKRARARQAPAPAAEKPAPDRPDPRFEELQQLKEQLAGGDYFRILGVDPGATGGSLQAAYARLAERTHPDRFSSASRALRDLAAEVHDQVNEAYQTLSDPKRLQEYNLVRKKAKRNEAQREQAELAFEAASEFRKGEAALNGRDYEIALQHFGRALELYPEEGDHHAHYGWALYLCHPGDSSIIGEALEHVRKGLKLASHREKPYLFMGRLYKTVGRADVAEKMFTRAVHIQPECVEALRELRLINMRREKSKGLMRRLLRR
ncbi:MAG: response regulator [Myxococcota bacterium]